MLAEIDESVVHLLDTVALTGIAPGHRWQLLAIGHIIVVELLLLLGHGPDVRLLLVLQLTGAQRHLGGNQLVVLLLLLMLDLMVLVLQQHDVAVGQLIVLLLEVAAADARHGNPCESLLV